MSGTHNILVVSDLHLGEDLSPSATEETSRDLRVAERQLVQFLRKYTRRRADGRPWRLVINGDMVDFLTICVFPDKHAVLRDIEHSHDEREHGLRRREDAAGIKLDAVVDRHPDFFRALARFLAVGNAVEVISGNHDTEFYWSEIQERLRDRVARTWTSMAASSRPGAATELEVRAAIRFHRWFYYEPGVVWIEHGHQYDECCSFEYNLNPVDARGEAIIPNVDTAGMRYVTNQIPEATPHGTEEWSFGGYLQFAAGLGWRGAWRLGRGYFLFALTLIRQWRKARISRSRRRRRALHRDQLRALSQTSPLDYDTLSELDAMQRPPVITNLRRLMQILMLDKTLVSLAAVFVVLVGLLALPLLWALLLAGAAVAGNHLAHQWLSRGRVIDADVPLQIVPSRILEHVDARYVIFGHTHIPIAQQLDSDEQGERWYFNTGTWVPSGKPGLLRSFTHVVIRRGKDGPVAALCQWRDGASRQFTPNWAPDESPSGESAPGQAARALIRAA